MSDLPTAPKPPPVPVVIEEPQVLPQEAVDALKRQGFADPLKNRTPCNCWLYDATAGAKGWPRHLNSYV